MPLSTLPRRYWPLLGIVAPLLLTAPIAVAVNAARAEAHRLTSAVAANPPTANDAIIRSYTATALISILANDVPGDTPLNPATVLLGQQTGTTNIQGLTGSTFSVGSSGQASVLPPLFTGLSVSTSIGYTV